MSSAAPGAVTQCVPHTSRDLLPGRYCHTCFMSGHGGSRLCGQSSHGFTVMRFSESEIRTGTVGLQLGAQEGDSERSRE